MTVFFFPINDYLLVIHTDAFLLLDQGLYFIETETMSEEDKTRS